MTKSMVKPHMLLWWTLDTILMSHVKLLGVSSFQTPDHQWATVPGVRPTGPQHQLDRIPWRPFGPLEADVSFVIPTIRLFYSYFCFRGYFIARQLFYYTPMVLMWLPQANNKPTVGDDGYHPFFSCWVCHIYIYIYYKWVCVSIMMAGCCQASFPATLGSIPDVLCRVWGAHAALDEPQAWSDWRFDHGWGGLDDTWLAHRRVQYWLVSTLRRGWFDHVRHINNS
jgi:hypothetical protein